jgi:hypothetical protein
MPAATIVRARALVDGVERTYALHSADVDVAPSTSPGNETAATTNTRTADSNEVTSSAGSDE